MLFGHQHNDASQSAPEPADVSAPSLNPLALDPTTGVSLPVATDTEPSATPAQTPSVLQQPTVATTLDPGSITPPPPPPPPTSAPTFSDTPAVPTPEPEDIPAPTETVYPDSSKSEEPVMPLDLPEPAPQPTPEPTHEPTADSSISSDDLIDIKQQALAELSPLVDQLDQTPEERFRTKMMMIQSTDNQALIRDAYDAAQQITDEKARAQALLDVINEINYFTSLNK